VCVERERGYRRSGATRNFLLWHFKISTSLPQMHDPKSKLIPMLSHAYRWENTSIESISGYKINDFSIIEQMQPLNSFIVGVQLDRVIPNPTRDQPKIWATWAAG